MRNSLCLVVTSPFDPPDEVENVGAGYRILVVSPSELVRRRCVKALSRAGFEAEATEFDDENEAAGCSPAAFDAVLCEPEGDVVDAALEALWSSG